MDADPILRCPYNPAHGILRSRMQAHIVKCKQNYPLADKVVCPFNAVHHVDRAEIDQHRRTCPDRRNVETHLFQMDDGTGDLAITPYHNPDLLETEENWDDTASGRTYNPKKTLETQPVYRIPVGCSKAAKKKFRMEERRRHERIMSGEPMDYGETSDFLSQPLRAPHGDSEALDVLETEGAQGKE